MKISLLASLAAIGVGTAVPGLAATFDGQETEAGAAAAGNSKSGAGILPGSMRLVADTNASSVELSLSRNAIFPATVSDARRLRSR